MRGSLPAGELFEVAVDVDDEVEWAAGLALDGDGAGAVRREDQDRVFRARPSRREADRRRRRSGSEVARINVKRSGGRRGDDREIRRDGLRGGRDTAGREEEIEGPEAVRLEGRASERARHTARVDRTARGESREAAALRLDGDRRRAGGSA